MTPERWQQIKTILQSALEQDRDERSAFLLKECGDDESLYVHVKSLIASHEQVGSFIENPAFEVMAESLANNGTDSAIGETLGHYKILRRLGSGGMGEVYLTEDTRLGRKVALKVLPSFFTKDEDRVRRFRQEARAASALNHPNILTIYEIGQIDSHHFIASEFIEGETVRHHMAETPMKIGEAVDIASQVAVALAAAHKTGIVHRDIKPENLMVRHDALVKVLDFGLAKLIENPKVSVSLVDTNQGVVMGTAHYMSPEQARGLPVDERTDIWSLGVVLYEMVGGRVPFSGETSSDVIVSILEKEPPTLTGTAPEVAEPLQSIITRTLQKDRDQRYQTANELAADLKSLQQELGLEVGEQRLVGSAISQQRAASRQPDLKPRETHTQNIGSRYKKIALAALLVALVAAVSYWWFAKSKNANTTASVRSIAVLPFKPLLAERPNESLEMGIADSLITRLSSLRQIAVRPISAVRKYNGLEQDPVTAGSELGVDAVLEGSIQWDEDKRIRVTARLWRVRDRSLIWTDNWVEQRADIFALEDLIAERMARAIEPTLSGAEQKLLKKHYTENVEAYQLYLKGRHAWNKRSEQGFSDGIKYFNQAIAKDPQYALAYAGLADSHILLSVGDYGVVAPKEAAARAKEAASRALQLDDTLAEAHTSLGFLNYVFDWDWANAENHFRRAIELNPNYATAHHWYALFLSVQGRGSEGLAEVRRALDLDPLSPIFNTDLGLIFYYQHEYDQAIEQLKKTLEVEPDFAVAHWRLALAYVQKGNLEQADQEVRRAVDLSGRSPVFLSTLGYVAGITGKQDEAARVLQELHTLDQRRYVLPNYFANIHLGLKQNEQALTWLQRAYEDRCSAMMGLKVDPIFNPLRSDPRFQELMKRVGFIGT